MNGKLIAFLSVILIGLGLTTYFIFKKNRELAAQLEHSNSLYEDASLQLGRAKNELGDANKKVSELSDNLQSQIKARQEVGKKYMELQAKYVAISEGIIVPVDGEHEVVDPTAPDFQYKEGHFYVATNEKLLDLGTGMKFTLKDNRITIQSKIGTQVDKQTKLLLPAADVSYKLQLRIHSKLITTIDPKGRENTYAEMYEMSEDGKQVLGKMELTKFDVVTNDQRKKHFELWNPHLDAGVLAGLETYSGKGQFGGSIGISIMSYGLTKNDMTWRFLRPGVTLSDKIGVNLSPVLYNIGEPIPLISNAWVGPYIGTNFSGANFGLMLNLVL